MSRFAQLMNVLLVAPLVLAACAIAPSGQPPVAPIAVKTSPVVPATIVGQVSFTGSVKSKASVNILPQVAGQITALNVDVGSVVKKNDVIAELNHAALDAQVAQAKAAVAVAQAKLAMIAAGSRSETIAEAKANLVAAEDRLAFMKSGGRPENVQAAQGTLTAAVARLNSLKSGRSESIDQAKANLAGARARLQQLKDGPTPDQIKEVELAVEQAKTAANAANAAKDAACGYQGAACQAAQAAAFAATEGINVAQAHLKTLTDPPTANQTNQAQAAIDAAQAQLALAEKPGSSNDLTAAQGAIESARAQVALAQASFSTADIAQAQAAVDDAQQQLKLTQEPYTQQDQDAATAAVQQAEAALQMTQVTRADATIKAPFSGIISQKFLSVGSMASPATPIVALVDPAVQVIVNVDENNANLIRTGEAATITADALPGKTIHGKVTSVAPTIDPQTRTIEAKITPTSQDSRLTDGMLAKVALATATHRGVIVVPTSAIVQRNGQATVFVVAKGIASPHIVQTGLTDGPSTEIVSGLKAGDAIVTSGQGRLSMSAAVTVQK